LHHPRKEIPIMQTLSIQQFRAAVGGAAAGGTLVRAYRELARRPELATTMRAGEWAAWPAAAVSSTGV
jgi:hypothetical protein